MAEVMSFTISPSKATIIAPSIRSSPQTNLVFNITSTVIYPKLSTFSCSHPKTPNPFGTRTAAAAGFQRTPTAARDRVIDFGKYKGKMLGSLPSSYLRWISKNLRAGDTEEWARFADQVLTDPVYRDRIEWEMAENVLNGSPNSNGDGSSAVKELLEISERFGWDNEDKIGWSKVDFGLLGTTKGGRIPRLRNGEMREEKKTKPELVADDGGRRKERRERMRRRRVEKTSKMVGRKEEEMMNVEEDDGGDDAVRVKNRFPGREALFNKVLNHQKLF
ncbi:hypothetical protein CASFOL_025153 [Castilleja foliolosa]|uniref:Uncharacterized protein n=1 Tax=Castilleja foliolosa TaxID=1961234 RepID=A0ABD3CSK2_9LAMI